MLLTTFEVIGDVDVFVCLDFLAVDFFGVNDFFVVGRVEEVRFVFLEIVGFGVDFLGETDEIAFLEVSDHVVFHLGVPALGVGRVLAMVEIREDK